MLNVFAVVFRESLEAVLVVGILFAYLKTTGNRPALKSMWVGILLGIVLSAALAWSLVAVDSELQGRNLDIFQNLLLLIAALLMIHMSIWMRTHSKKIKKELEGNIKEALQDSAILNIAGISMIAVAREGSETVIFLYGMAQEAIQQSLMPSFVMAALAGFGVALGLWYLIQKGLRFFSLPKVFGVTTIFLLVSASQLLMKGINGFVSIGLIQLEGGPLWDLSKFFSDSEGPAGIVSSWIGFSSSPNYLAGSVFVIYWLFVTYEFLLRERFSTKK